VCSIHQEKFPEIKTFMGGGFPNTELRDLKEKEFLNSLILLH
jgi:hypothetical protein